MTIMTTDSNVYLFRNALITTNTGIRFDSMENRMDLFNSVHSISVHKNTMLEKHIENRTQTTDGTT